MISIKKQTFFPTESRRYNPRVCTEPQRPRIAKAILREKNKARGITSRFQTQSYITKLQWSKQHGIGTKRHGGEWCRIGEPRRENLHTYGQVTHDKAGMNIQWRKDNFQQTVLESWTATCETVKLEHSPSHHTQNKLTMVQRHKHRTRHHETPEKYTQQTF